jgi:uncharacterized membrane protein SpoIIM required for sporulation
MKVADLLDARRENWRQLEILCAQLENRRKRRYNGPMLTRFAALYRAACADLALADAYHLPPATIHYLHQLVGRAHNQLYRSRTFDFRAWGEEMFLAVPQRLFHDKCLWIAFGVFWGFFLLSMFLASDSSPMPDFAERAVGEEQLREMERMYDVPIQSRDRGGGGDSVMAGFYIQHNTGIGLRCFASGLLLGVGGLFTTVFNAVSLGAIFGHMTTVPQADNFFHFVTAHGPFELTAIILSAAAGMRLGFALVQTDGMARVDSLRKAAREAMPTMGAAMVLFLLAALIEGFLSPSSVPYAIKAFVSVLSSALLMFYFVILGYPRDDGTPTG